MALVMLPCDMPWWPTLQRHLTQTSSATTPKQLVFTMEKIINLCNVGLDDEESEDITLPCLEKYLNDTLSNGERAEFFDVTLPQMVSKALELKSLRPPSGLHFSLQQQGDSVELDRDFVSSLLAHAFFSTFPKRTPKTHPTLQDFNFNHFFKYLHLDTQKYKLHSFIYYFNYIGKCKPSGKIIVSRKVLIGSEWLTLEDWLTCRLPLCHIFLRRQGTLSDSPLSHLRLLPSSSHIGLGVLTDSATMECKQMMMCPEMLIMLLFVEALEDNETIIIEGVLQVATFADAKPIYSPLTTPLIVSMLCMDGEDYSGGAQYQYYEDSILRELNKCLSGFRQGRPVSRFTMLPRRLSPIGESFSSTPDSYLPPPYSPNQLLSKSGAEREARRMFIVLGSSGECLAVSRSDRQQSPARSASPEFFSARSSFTDNTEDEGAVSRRGCKEDRSSVFAQRLKEALDRAEKADAVFSEYRYGGEGSCGFVLEDGLVEEELKQRRKHLAASSNYSFTADSEMGSWCDEVLGRWLEEEGGGDFCGGRKEAVAELAGALLKRTLSETWAGVSLPGVDPPLSPPPPLPHTPAPRSLSLELARNRLAAHLVCSVLEKTRSEGGGGEGCKPVATCNWGCDHLLGHPQLKLLIQWISASVALIPHLLYYTAAHPDLNMVDTLCRVVVDRQWSVGELLAAILSYSKSHIRHNDMVIDDSGPSLFETIISLDSDKTKRPS